MLQLPAWDMSRVERRVFGPVPSRRLGQSLGINNVPPKTCSYSCAYCQLGPTSERSVVRRAFQDVDALAEEVRSVLEALTTRGQGVDHLTFVPDGEPTLDRDLGREIDALRRFGIPIAVITNASLLGDADVRRDLARADWVSLKVDAAAESTWLQINRPAEALRLDAIQAGMRAFAAEYAGDLNTETMLLQGINDRRAVVQETAHLVGELSPRCAYLGVPTRPTAEAWARVPTEATLIAAYACFREQVARVELLTDTELGSFGFTGSVRDDLLATTSVHPMREDEVHAFLEKAGAKWPVVEELVRLGELKSVEHRGRRFYVRRFRRHVSPS
jgi:wyosine [tRNA(Phe)-imidazoG37] synthetase (radical SAM superfamily)